MNIINQFTLRTLKKNRTRSIITIIGIILSTAMFVSVTTSIKSLQQYLFNVEVETVGDWQGVYSGLSEKETEFVLKQKAITKATVMNTVGTAKITNKKTKDYAYFNVFSAETSCKNFVALKKISGHFPKNDSEIMVPQNLVDANNKKYQIGKKLSLQIGHREVAGQKKLFTEELTTDDKENALDKVVDCKPKSYTIVGIYKSDTLLTGDYCYYNLLTTKAADQGQESSIYFKVSDSKKITKNMHAINKKLHLKDRINQNIVLADTHSELLQYAGKSPNHNFMNVVEKMGIILMIIIMIASISLIYNAFSISLNERIKQFGILKSIGATKKQMRASVIFEAFLLCIVGIPLGIGVGLLGIGITLHFTGGVFSRLYQDDVKTTLHMVISISAILIASATALLTVFISAMIPVIRAIRMSAIEALRQNNTIQLKSTKFRSSKVIGKLFGFEATLAQKNMKRNKRKYRTTILSLVFSIMLFLAASSFSMYMKKSIRIYDSDATNDIAVRLRKDIMKDADCTIYQLFSEICKDKNIDDASMPGYINGYIMLEASKCSDEYIKYRKANQADVIDKDGKIKQDMSITFINDESYEKYLENNNLDKKIYMDQNNPRPLVWDEIRYSEQDGKYKLFKMTKEKDFSGEIYTHNKDKKEHHLVLSHMTNQTGNKMPTGTYDFSWNCTMQLLFPTSAMDTVIGDSKTVIFEDISIKAEQYHEKVAKNIGEIAKKHNILRNTSSYIIDQRAAYESTEKFLMVIDIFSYGFIILISLIVVANVFNTISTNIRLRRQEFAMLKSVGMTQKGFDKMMNYECILYGLFGLLWGVPLSLVINLLMYKSLQNGWNLPFTIPWINVIIAIISVFAIVFASMIYSMKKIKKENIIETLREDNI